MGHLTVIADSYFDGHRHQNAGPYRLQVENGSIISIEPVARKAVIEGSAVDETSRYFWTPFLMPGLVEAHCHLFLDGGVLDFKARSNYLQAPVTDMMAVARQNVDRSLARGITLIRDAGDRYGINQRIKDEVKASGGCKPGIRSPGLGIRRPARYGSFMASEAATDEGIVRAIEERRETSDDLKIILTGIIDFEAGAVMGAPQFGHDSLNLIVETAHKHNLLTFAHCSGLEGLALAVDAGVDSIEHGFFMDHATLEHMAEKKIAWVPTFSPVHFQWVKPTFAGWNSHTLENLQRIIDAHKVAIVWADELGVPIVAGSDAGSHGVRHGDALIDELFFLLASGLPMASVLRSATSTPRALWGETSADLVPGGSANFIALGGSPFLDPAQLWNVEAVYKEQLHRVSGTGEGLYARLSELQRAG